MPLRQMPESSSPSGLGMKSVVSQWPSQHARLTLASNMVPERRLSGLAAALYAPTLHLTWTWRQRVGAARSPAVAVPLIARTHLIDQRVDEAALGQGEVVRMPA